MQLENITFRDYVREALYPNEDVRPLEAFKGWHEDLFIQISDRLENVPKRTEEFVQVVRVSVAVPTPFPRLMILMAGIAERKPGALGDQPKCVVCTASSFRYRTCASTPSQNHLLPSPRPLQTSKREPRRNIEPSRIARSALSMEILDTQF